eukprot:ANDGO_07788.mRNA.1 hypothetical protein
MVFSIVASMIRFPIHTLILIVRLGKEASMGLLVLYVLDHFHLSNQLLRHKYAKLFHKRYTPLYVRAVDSLQMITQQLTDQQVLQQLAAGTQIASSSGPQDSKLVVSRK